MRNRAGQGAERPLGDQQEGAEETQPRPGCLKAMYRGGGNCFCHRSCVRPPGGAGVDRMPVGGDTGWPGSPSE